MTSISARVVVFLALVYAGACSELPSPTAPSNSSSLKIATTQLPPGVRGQEYGERLQAINCQEPCEWSWVDGELPAGASLLTPDGAVVANRLLDYGRYLFRVRVRDGSGQSVESEVKHQVLCENEHLWTADGRAYAKVIRKIPTCGDSLKVSAPKGSLPDVAIEFWQDKWLKANVYVSGSQDGVNPFRDGGYFDELPVSELGRGTKATTRTGERFPGPGKEYLPRVGWLMIWMIDTQMAKSCGPIQPWTCQGADLIGFVELNWPLVN